MADLHCSRCDGTGFVVLDDAVATAVQQCTCRFGPRGEPDLLGAGIPRRFLRTSLATYRPATSTQERALAIARDFAGIYPAVDRGLAFYGDCGTGKTHLAIGIVRELVVEQAARAVFCDYHDLLKRIQATYGRAPGGPSEQDILEPIFAADVLVLDDLGSRRSTEWAEEVVDRLFANRYNDGKVTILTTNLPVQYFSEKERATLSPGTLLLQDCIGARSHSRLYEMCQFVALDGPDHRSMS